jgi:hypothetical protein
VPGQDFTRFEHAHELSSGCPSCSSTLASCEDLPCCYSCSPYRHCTQRPNDMQDSG